MGTIIQDFAASVLMEFESWVLHADPIGAILSSPLEVQSVLTVEEVKQPVFLFFFGDCFLLLFLWNFLVAFHWFSGGFFWIFFCSFSQGFWDSL